MAFLLSVLLFPFRSLRFLFRWGIRAVFLFWIAVILLAVFSSSQARADRTMETLALDPVGQVALPLAWTTSSIGQNPCYLVWWWDSYYRYTTNISGWNSAPCEGVHGQNNASGDGLYTITTNDRYPVKTSAVHVVGNANYADPSYGPDYHLVPIPTPSMRYYLSGKTGPGQVWVGETTGKVVYYPAVNSTDGSANPVPYAVFIDVLAIGDDPVYGGTAEAFSFADTLHLKIIVNPSDPANPPPGDSAAFMSSLPPGVPPPSNPKAPPIVPPGGSSGPNGGIGSSGTNANGVPNIPDFLNPVPGKQNANGAPTAPVGLPTMALGESRCLPSKIGYYSPLYCDGFAGIWNRRAAEINQTNLMQLLTFWGSIKPPGADLPTFEIDLSKIGVKQAVHFEFPSASIWLPWIKVLVMLSAVSAAIRIAFVRG